MIVPTRSRLSRRALAVLLSGLALAATAQERPAAAPGATPGAAIQVTGFRLGGNTLLPQPQVDAALQPFKGRRTLEQLQAAAAAVQALYAQAGYGAVVVFVPPQSPADGIVSLNVVEGRLARISISGQSQFSTANVAASLPALQTGRTPRLRDIDGQLQMANENTSKQTQVLLLPGQAPGEVDAQITLTERPLQRWTVSLDNTGNDRTGDFRAGLSWRHANLSDQDDVLTAQFTTSPDEPSAVKVFSLGYRLPLYGPRVMLDAYAARSDVDGGSTPTAAGDLRFNGRGRLFGVRAGWFLPRWGEVDQRLALGLDHRDYLNQCGIVGLPQGVCGPAGESVSVQPLTLEYTVRAGGALTWGAGASLIANLQLGGRHTSDASFEAVRTGARPGYVAVRASAFAGTAVWEDWQLFTRASAQWSEDALVPGEQFGIGGGGSVRGYEERELVGDRGVQWTFELSSPALGGGVGGGGGGGSAGPAVRALAFGDAGHVDNRLGAPCQEGRASCTLASVGLGLRVDSPRTQLRADLGFALKDALRTRKNDTRLHLAVNHSF